MITKITKKRNRFLGASSFFVIVAAIFLFLTIIYLIFSNIKILRKRSEITAQLNIYYNEINDLKNKNNKLRENIEKLNNKEYIEKALREEGFQKEGEKVVSFIFPSEQTKEKEEKNFWQPTNWWQWFVKKWQEFKDKF